MHVPCPARRPRALLLLGLTLPLVPAAGCSAPREGGEDPGSQRAEAPHADAEPGATRPWTAAFLDEAVLVAREVRIEGPPGLLEHVAVRQEPPYTVVSVRTTPEGLLQEVALADDAPDTEIRAQLDNLAIAAERRLIVLERPGPVPVVVDATGDVYHARRDGSGERRGETLRLVGDPAR